MRESLVVSEGASAPGGTRPDASRRKEFRYVLVSVAGMVCTQVALLAGQLFGLTPTVANTAACLTAAFPVLALNRRWVWELDCRASVRHELVPFWGLTLLGLVASTAAVGAVSVVSTHPLVVAATNIAAFGVLWVAKFLALDAAARRITGDADQAPVRELDPILAAA